MIERCLLLLDTAIERHAAKSSRSSKRIFDRVSICTEIYGEKKKKKTQTIDVDAGNLTL